MPAPTLSQLFAVGIDVLRTVINGATGIVSAQLGSVASESVDTTDAEWWQHVGFISRPAAATAKQSACQAVTIRRGDRDVIVATRDLRGITLAGQLKDGETCIYAPGADGSAQGRILLKADGSVSVYSRTDGAAKGMVISVTPSSDTIAIVNAAGFGLIIDGNGVRLTAKDAGLSLGADGNVKLIGKGKTQVDGAGIVIGSAAVTGANSALHGVSGVAGVPSAKVLIE